MPLSGIDVRCRLSFYSLSFPTAGTSIYLHLLRHYCSLGFEVVVVVVVVVVVGDWVDDARPCAFVEAAGACPLVAPGPVLIAVTGVGGTGLMEPIPGDVSITLGNAFSLCCSMLLPRCGRWSCAKAVRLCLDPVRSPSLLSGLFARSFSSSRSFLSSFDCAILAFHFPNRPLFSGSEPLSLRSSDDS
jgi:hypothetical protein